MTPKTLADIQVYQNLLSSNLSTQEYCPIKLSAT